MISAPRLGAAWLSIVLLAAPAFGAVPAAHGKHHGGEIPTRKIAIVINGTPLPPDPAPLVIGGRLFVPVVRIYSALAISVSRDGDAIVATTPRKVIRITIGSARALVGSTPVTLDAPVLARNGATYVPLRFVADSLGAVVSYDAQDGRVEIVSSLVGRAPAMAQAVPGGGVTITGIVAALDANSAPPTLTVTRGQLVRTIAIGAHARTTIQDVTTRTSLDGQLAAVHVGDSVTVTLAKDGSVLQILDLYASRAGTVVAVSPTAIVLGDGRVVTPTRATTITLNGDPVGLDALRSGDAVLVRSNPETGEDREIIASRAVAAAPAPASSSGPSIAAFAIGAQRPLRAGASFDVTLQGTPGGRASYDIGTFVTGLPMREERPGFYAARYTVPGTVNFTAVPVFGHLAVGTAEAPRAQAAQTLTVATLPPQIPDVAPAPNRSVNNARPSIYATFDSPTNVPVDVGSATISVDGHDVTASALRTASFVAYDPPNELRDGPVTVTVKVADAAGNVATRTWSFSIRAR